MNFIISIYYLYSAAWRNDYKSCQELFAFKILVNFFYVFKGLTKNVLLRFHVSVFRFSLFYYTLACFHRLKHFRIQIFTQNCWHLVVFRRTSIRVLHFENFKIIIIIFFDCISSCASHATVHNSCNFVSRANYQLSIVASLKLVKILINPKEKCRHKETSVSAHSKFVTLWWWVSREKKKSDIHNHRQKRKHAIEWSQITGFIFAKFWWKMKWTKLVRNACVIENLGNIFKWTK